MVHHNLNQTTDTKTEEIENKAFMYKVWSKNCAYIIHTFYIINKCKQGYVKCKNQNICAQIHTVGSLKATCQLLSGRLQEQRYDIMQNMYDLNLDDTDKCTNHDHRMKSCTHNTSFLLNSEANVRFLS